MEISNHVLDCKFKNLANISQLRGIRLVHQNIRGLLGKKDVLETLFSNEKFIMSLSEPHVVSVNSKLFQIPVFKFIHKDRITVQDRGVTIYLSNVLRWKRWTILKQMKQSVFEWKFKFLKVKVFLLVAYIDPQRLF